MQQKVHKTLSEDTVRQIAAGLDEPAWVTETRLEALAALEDLDMPHVIRTPGRDWTNLANLDFESLVDPLEWRETKDQAGPDDAVVLPISEAFEEYGDVIKSHFGNAVDPQQNYLTALSTALFTTGTFVYVPEGVQASDVVIRTEMNSRSLFNYTLIVTEESSSVTILERQTSGEDVDGDRYYSGIVEIAAGENSNVQYGTLQELSENTYNFQIRRALTENYANVKWIEGNFGSRLSKTSLETKLTGDGSETKIVGAFYGHRDQHFDITARVHHAAEHTTADLITRGVLDDEARSVYEGVQYVGDDAWNTSSYQRENTLMLSDDAEADASPKLEIDNHETEASHAASVGQVDKEDLFYMLSRTLPEETAVNMLVEGFFVPIIDEVESAELREDLQGLIKRRLAE